MGLGQVQDNLEATDSHCFLGLQQFVKLRMLRILAWLVNEFGTQVFFGGVPAKHGNMESWKPLPKTCQLNPLPDCTERQIRSRISGRGLLTHMHLLQHVRHSYSILVDVD